MTRARVLHLIKGLGLGGAERLLERAAPHFDRREFEYHVGYLVPWKNALVPALQGAGLPVHCLNMTTIADVRVMPRLLALLRRERFDLVHAHLPLTGVLARVAKRLGGVRHAVYTEHSMPFGHRRITRALNMRTYQWNDAVIAVSLAVADQVRPCLRGSRVPLRMIPNAIDAEALEGQAADRAAVCREFGFPPDARIVIHVGNLRPVKGHRYLLAAARRVIAQIPQARFLLVGLGPLTHELMEEARRLDLDGRVVFAGFRPDATALIGAADLFVLSSLDEGIPVSLLEAMALGRPAVLTRVGGIPEVAIPGETAALVEPKDVDGLTQAIAGLLADPERRVRMGEQARRHVRNRFGMAQMVEAVEGVYREVLQH